MALAVAEVTAGPGLTAFADGERRDGEAGDGVHPPPAEEAVGGEPDQDDGREIGAELGFSGVGPERDGTESGGNPTLGPRERGHYHQREGNQHEADAAVAGRLAKTGELGGGVV